MNFLPIHFLMLIFAGWISRHLQDAIEYLQEEDRALQKQLGGKRLRFTDQQRRRLSEEAKQSRQKWTPSNRNRGSAGYFAAVVSAADREEM